MSDSVETGTSASRRPKCPALSGVRIFAALHIYVFHLKQAHDAGVSTISALDHLPSLTLTQAWIPKLAIWWNAPAWALSAFVAFYVILPAFARLTARLERRGLVVLAGMLALFSWLGPVSVEPRGLAGLLHLLNERAQPGHTLVS
jgi:peptidoglycan/LPS O-acetylase OafA/YrhL